MDSNFVLACDLINLETWKLLYLGFEGVVVAGHLAALLCGIGLLALIETLLENAHRLVARCQLPFVGALQGLQLK